MTSANQLVNTPPQNKDFVLSVLADQYTYPFFEYLGIIDHKAEMTPLPTIILCLDHIRRTADKLYMLKDKSLLHIEFDSTGRKEHLPRYLLVAASIADKYNNIKIDRKTIYRRQKVRTVVVYTAGARLSPNGCVSQKNPSFEFQRISLPDFVDGDKILSELKKKHRSKRSSVLSQADAVKLALAPLGKIRGDKERRKEFCEEAVSFADSLPKVYENTNALCMVVCAASSFLDKQDIVDLCALDEEEYCKKGSVDRVINMISGGRFFKCQAAINKAERTLAALKVKTEAEKAKREKAEKDLAAEKAKTKKTIEKALAAERARAERAKKALKAITSKTKKT
jgi:hypothetical protein